MISIVKNWLTDVLIVLSFSQKTQWVLLIGVILSISISINILGEIMLEDFQLHGFLQPIGEVIRDKLLRRYDKLALLTLISFFLLALKTYSIDKKRLYRLF
jgi:hypothetical protein